MRFLFVVFSETISQRIRSVKSWLVILMLPLIILCLGSTRETERSTLITVGVVLPESGGETIWELLTERNEGFLRFVEADLETVDRNVASGRWDCGLILPEDFDSRIEKLDMDRIVKLRISEGSTVYPLVQESVSACLARLVAPYIAQDYLMDSQILGDVEIDQIQAQMEQVYNKSNHVEVTLKSLDGTPLVVPELTEQGIQRILCWLVSVTILVKMLFGATDLGAWYSSGAVRRMQPLRTVVGMATARAAADCLLMVFSGCVAMLLLDGGAWGCLAVLGYGLFWLAVSVLLAQFPLVYPALPLCIPFLVVISFLVSSVLADITLLLPSISTVSALLPVTLFLRTCRGDWLAMTILFAAACFCQILAVVIGRYRHS